MTRACWCRCRMAARPATCCGPAASRGCSITIAICVLVVVSPLVNDPAFQREFAHPRVMVEDLPPHQPAGLEARLLALMQASYLNSAITESVRIRRLEAKANGIDPLDRREAPAGAAGGAVDDAARQPLRRQRSAHLASLGGGAVRASSAGDARHVESGPDPGRSAAAAGQRSAARSGPLPSTRAGTTSRTSCCRFAASIASSSGTT